MTYTYALLVVLQSSSMIIVQTGLHENDRYTFVALPYCDVQRIGQCFLQVVRFFYLRIHLTIFILHVDHESIDKRVRTNFSEKIFYLFILKDRYHDRQ